MVTTSTGVSTLLGWNRSVKRSELPVPFHHQKGTLTDGRFLGPGSSTLVAGLLECRAFHKATHFCSVWFWPNGPLQSLAANMEYQAVQKRYQAIPDWVVWKWGRPPETIQFPKSHCWINIPLYQILLYHTHLKYPVVRFMYHVVSSYTPIIIG